MPSRFFKIRKSERSALIYSAAYFFFLLFSYYLLRPLREEMGIRGDLENLPWLWTGTTITMLLFSPVFAALVSRLPRRKFIPLVYRFFLIHLLIFWSLFYYLPFSMHLSLGYVFYIWLSVFNLFAVSVFWGFMADVWNSEQGKRLFGFISLGGTLGAVVGASVPAYLGQSMGTLSLFLLSAAMLEISVRCFAGLVTNFGLDLPFSRRFEPSSKVWEGFVLLARSPYLLMIIVNILLFTITNASIYFLQARIIQETYLDSLQRIAIFGRIDFWVNILTFVTEAFGTGPLLRRFGLIFGLSALPFISIFGFTALAFDPSLAILVNFVVLRRATHYAIDRPSREILFTVVGPDAKYKSKNFIDTFVSRTGDLAGAWLTKVGAMTAAIAIFLSTLWLGSAWFLARWQARRQAVVRNDVRSS